MRVSSSCASIAAIASLATVVVAAPLPFAAAANADNAPPAAPPAAPAPPGAPDLSSILGLPASPLAKRDASLSMPLETRQLDPVINLLSGLLGPTLDQILSVLGLQREGASASSIQSLAAQLTPDQVSRITALVKNASNGSSLGGATSSLPVVGSLL